MGASYRRCPIDGCKTYIEKKVALCRRDMRDLPEAWQKALTDTVRRFGWRSAQYGALLNKAAGVMQRGY